MHGKPTGRSFLSEAGATIMFLLLVMRPLPAVAQSGIYLSYKNTPLKTVLESISRQSNFRFVYTDELKIDTYIVSIESYNELPDILFRKIFNPPGHHLSDTRQPSRRRGALDSLYQDRETRLQG